MVFGKGEETVVGGRAGNEYGDGVAWIRGPVIGKGSFGCVYLASLRNPRSKYSYFPPVMAVKSAEVSASGSIQKEREVLGNVKGCGDIIRCFGEETTVGEGGSMVFNLLLEYGSGGTLAERIRNSGGKGLPEFEAKVFVKCLLRGLTHIHNIGYVHCDLKPENILLVPDGRGRGLRAKIGDFGLAKRAEKQSKKRKAEPYWRGTPMYLPPEAVTENLQEAPSDVWALGCIVLEMLTGKPPWSGDEELSGDDLIRKIGEGRESPRIPNGISKEARDFLKGCFVRKSMYRLTADMLLLHPFVEDLDEDVFDDDDGGLQGEVEDLDELESILLVCESESESESDCGSFEEDWDVGSFSYWSEDDAEEDEVTSQGVELKEEEIINGGGDDLNRASKKPRQSYPVSFTIPAGV